MSSRRSPLLPSSCHLLIHLLSLSRCERSWTDVALRAGSGPSDLHLIFSWRCGSPSQHPPRLRLAGPFRIRHPTSCDMCNACHGRCSQTSYNVPRTWSCSPMRASKWEAAVDFLAVRPCLVPETGGDLEMCRNSLDAASSGLRLAAVQAPRDPHSMVACGGSLALAWAYLPVEPCGHALRRP